VLKLNYTDVGLFLEQVAAPIEVLVAQRVVLAMRSGQSLHVESGNAAFLIPADAPDLVYLQRVLQKELQAEIALSPVDQEFVEICIEGTWIAQDTDANEGTFVTAFSPETEFFLCKLWQTSQEQVTVLP